MQGSTKWVVKAAKVLAGGVLVASAGVAQATFVPLDGVIFQGRLADGTHSTTCTVSGPTKCAMIYDSHLGITILNNWNIGTGTWDGSATPAVGSAQALAEAAGVAATGLTGWKLPTGDGHQAAGALNQFLSIWNDVGGSFAGLQSEFDGVQTGLYWSGSENGAPFAWVFDTYDGFQPNFDKLNPLFAVAVRSGDVAAVSEPESMALVLVGLMAAGLARRRRPL